MSGESESTHSHPSAISDYVKFWHFRVDNLPNGRRILAPYEKTVFHFENELPSPWNQLGCHRISADCRTMGTLQVVGNPIEFPPA